MSSLCAIFCARCPNEKRIVPVLISELLAPGGDCRKKRNDMMTDKEIAQKSIKRGRSLGAVRLEVVVFERLVSKARKEERALLETTVRRLRLEVEMLEQGGV